LRTITAGTAKEEMLQKKKKKKKKKKKNKSMRMKRKRGGREKGEGERRIRPPVVAGTEKKEERVNRANCSAYKGEKKNMVFRIGRRSRREKQVLLLASRGKKKKKSNFSPPL